MKISIILFIACATGRVRRVGKRGTSGGTSGWLPVWWTISESILSGVRGRGRIYLNKTKSDTRYTATSPFQFGQLCAIITAGFWFSIRFPWILVNAFDYVTRIRFKRIERERVGCGICTKIHPVNLKNKCECFHYNTFTIKRHITLVLLSFFFYFNQDT